MPRYPSERRMAAPQDLLRILPEKARERIQLSERARANQLTTVYPGGKVLMPTITVGCR
jgi:hypothetical protein